MCGAQTEQLQRHLRSEDVGEDVLERVVNRRLRPVELVERALEAISEAARTGKIGDGKIFVYGIEQVIRIRTGETGVDAI